MPPQWDNSYKKGATEGINFSLDLEMGPGGDGAGRRGSILKNEGEGGDDEGGEEEEEEYDYEAEQERRRKKKEKKLRKKKKVRSGITSLLTSRSLLTRSDPLSLVTEEGEGTDGERGP